MKIPTQPIDPYYNLDAIHCADFDYVDRHDYYNKTGKQAPIGDPTKPKKSWTMNSGGTFNLIYPQTTSIIKTTFTDQEAAAVNFPGVPTFPPYSVGQTDAVTVFQGVAQPVNPQFLCTIDEAMHVLTLMGIQGNLYSMMQLGGVPIDYRTEQRRIWAINLHDDPAQVLMLSTKIQEMNSMGVGYPGSFINGAWRAAQLPSQDFTLPAYPTPCRDLFPNERLVLTGGPIANTIVVNTTMNSVYNPISPNPTTTASAGGGIDPATLQKINDTFSLISQLAAIYHLKP